MQHFAETIATLMRDHEGWAAPIAFLVAFGESLCFASLLWPGWIILVLFSGALAGSGVSPVVVIPMVIAAGLGGAAGYAVSYWIGLYFKDSIARIWPFKSDPTLIPRGEEFFQRYGAWSVFLGHFFGPVRAVIPVIAGMFKMRQMPFQLANVTSAFIWAAGAVLAPFWSIYFKDEIFTFIREHEMLAAFGMFLLALVHALPIPLIFWPSVVLLVAGGFIYLLAGGTPSFVLLAGAAGVFLGDLIGYRAGEARKDMPQVVWPLSWYPDGIPAARKFLERWGALGVISSKFLGVGRAYVPVVAGAVRMAPAKFIPASLISAMLAVAACLSPHFVLQFFGWGLGH